MLVITSLEMKRQQNLVCKKLSIYFLNKLYVIAIRDLIQQ